MMQSMLLLLMRRVVVPLSRKQLFDAKLCLIVEVALQVIFGRMIALNPETVGLQAKSRKVIGLRRGVAFSGLSVCSFLAGPSHVGRPAF